MPNQTDAHDQSAKTLNSIEALKVSRARWIVWLVVLGYFGGAWYSGQHARESYAKGYEAGRLSTAEGRETAELERLQQARDHLVCDANGRNCYNR
jgi:hypothetical protein